MPSLADAYMSGFRKKSGALAPSPPPPPAPVSTPAPIQRKPSGSAPTTGELGKTVANEALDALNTITVLRMATAGNLMAEDFVSKLDHHLRAIVRAAQGDLHWPDKFRQHFQDELPPAPAPENPPSESAAVSSNGSNKPVASPSQAPQPILSPLRTIIRKASSLFSEAATGGGEVDVDLTEGEKLGNFDFAEDDDDDEDRHEHRKTASSAFRLMSSPKKPAKAKGKANDVDIYNIINAEEKDTGAKKRKGLALGQGLSHAIKTCLFGDTAGNLSTKHPPASFTQNRATDVTFQDVTFSFQEYAPTIFLSIREHFGINNAAFTKSMKDLKGGQVGEGKSGMLFFSTADREYIVKTVTSNEMRFLERELKSYYDYMVVNGATSLLPRFVGLYFLKLPDKPIVRLIVMNNVFKLPKERSIELVEMYDLKGSLHTRYVGAEEAALGKVSVLKDLNFCNRHDGSDHHGREIKATDGPCRAIYLGPIRKIELLANLQSDVEWLRQHNIMDYSLLMAVGFEVSPDDPSTPREQPPAQVEGGVSVWQSAWSADLGGVKGMNGDFTERAEIYYMGIIDILQEYNAKKRAEHTFKSFTADSTKISAVDPDFYAERFLGWMEQHVL